MIEGAVGAYEADDIRKLVERILKDLGNPEPPLRLDQVRQLLSLDVKYYSLTNPTLLQEVAHRMKVAGKQVIARPTILLDVVKKASLSALWVPDGNRILTGQLKENDRAAARVDAIVGAASRLGVAISPEDVLECPYTISGARNFVRSLLVRPNRPTAIFCSNDILGLATMLAARELGLDVPRDISVIGHGDFDMDVLLSPALTTIKTPDALLGEGAADYLISMVNGLPASGRVQLPCEVLPRGTTAAAAGGP